MSHTYRTRQPSGISGVETTSICWLKRPEMAQHRVVGF